MGSVKSINQVLQRAMSMHEVTVNLAGSMHIT